MTPPSSSSAPVAGPAGPSLTGHLSLQTPLGGVLTDQRVRLLEAIDRVGSLNRAAKEVPLSYKAAWDALDSMNTLAPEPLVLRSVGGAGGGGTRLTDYARQLIHLYRAMQSSQQDVLNRLPTLDAVSGDADAAQLRTLIRRMTMKTSARNQFAGTIVALTDRQGLVDVVLALGPQDRITATITPEAAQDMGLRLGDELFALVKAPGVSVSRQAPTEQAGLNILSGRLAALRATQRHVGCSVVRPSGLRIQAVMTDEWAAECHPEQAVWAVFPSDSVVLVSFQ